MATVIRSPTRLESLSSNCWRFLAQLVIASGFTLHLASRDMEMMRSFEEAEDWEKLGAWLVVVWSYLPWSSIPEPESMGGIEEVTSSLPCNDRRPSRRLKIFARQACSVNRALAARSARPSSNGYVTRHERVDCLWSPRCSQFLFVLSGAYPF